MVDRAAGRTPTFQGIRETVASLGRPRRMYVGFGKQLKGFNHMRNILAMEKKGIIAITGSSGLIGSALVERFVSEGYLVVGLDMEGPPYPPAEAECIYVNLTSDQSTQDAMALIEERHGRKLTSFIHLAAYYSFSGEASHLYKSLTEEGTRRCLRELQRWDVEQFIFSSTMLVHKPCEPGQKIDESWPLEPKWDYPRSKVETEKIISECRGKIPALILRIAGVYDEWCHSIPISHQIQRIYEHQFKGHLFPGDMKHGQSFVHLSDLVDCFVLAVERRDHLPADMPILIGEPVTFSYETLQRKIGSLLHGNEWFTEYVPKPIAKAGAWVEGKLPGAHEFIKPWMIDLADDHYELDISRARYYLGWQPKHNLLGTIPAMVDNLKKDPVKFYKINKLPLTYIQSVA